MIPLCEFFAATQGAMARGADREISVPIGFLDDLYRATTLDEVLGVYSVWGRQITRADRCSVALRDGPGQLMIHALNGAFGIAKGTVHRTENTVVGQVYARREMLFLPDVARVDQIDARRVQALGYAAAVFAPIITSDRCFGALCVTYKNPLDNPGKPLALLQAMARCLATQLLVIEQMKSLRLMARTDALTGAKNRHFLSEQSDHVWQAWRQDDVAFSFLSLDIDHFKAINDSHGHDVGDAVLRMLVDRLQGNVRGQDTLIRTGGEEFGLLMARVGLDDAIPMASRLRETVVSQPFAICDLRLPITVSFGIAAASQADQTFEDVVKRSDVALYRAKETGRDRIIVARDDQLLPA